jgi:DNA-directed DNA polymerase III PolC
MFIHLHTHSYYSFLNGLLAPQELAEAAARFGAPALALTDMYGLTGAVEFYDACQSLGVKPILGLELDLAAPVDFLRRGAGSESGNDKAYPWSGAIVLLAADLDGWGSLCRLSSALQTDPAIAGSLTLPFERLAQDTAGLLCLTGGRRSLVTRLISTDQEQNAREYLGSLSELFPDRLYVELQKHVPSDDAWIERLSSLGKRLALAVVATHDVFYLKLEEAALQRVATGIRLNKKLNEVRAEAAAPPAAYLTSPEQMAESFASYPGALAKTLEINERCRLELPLGKAHFPEAPTPPGLTALDVLRGKAETGARQLYNPLTPEIQARLDHELEVIGQCGYTALFLIMQEIVEFACQNGIPISSRGSAASSLVAHCLGITSPDPMRLNLYFERFLNPARLTPPDIDTDLCSRRRDEVICFVYERFGQERVAMVCTINRLRRRSALREVAKVYGLPAAQIKTLADALPHRWFGPPSLGFQDLTPYGELTEQYPSPLHQAIFRDATALLGKPDHLSIHPGGVVIAPGRLTDLAPTQMAAKGVVITQFDLETIERLGLVKIDLLGIRGLTVLGDVSQAILESADSPVTSANPLDVLEAIPQDDPATADLLQNGRTIGCFQIESPGMRATLKEIKAQSVDDLMVALALYRPGPLTGGLKDAFVRRHRGLEPSSQLHPALTPLLEDTYGVILYQEQVLRIAHELAGLSLADSDLLRRAMSHFDPGGQMQTLKEKFIAGALARNAVPEAVAERIWELMAAFSGYGFPKAHAASYAVIGWRAAWCKTHYPELFMAAVLANWGGYYPQRVYLTEARRLGLALRPPDVEHALPEFSVGYVEGAPVLFMGLNQVRELTRKTMGRILRNRPFRSLTDFLARVDPQPVEAENLARAGALEGFGNPPALLERLQAGSWRGGQLPLFGMETAAQAGEEDWSLAEKVAAQEAILGASVAAHPLELVADQVAAAGALSTLEAVGRVGQTVRVAGMRQTWGRSSSGRNKTVYFMSLEDLEGTLDVVIFADVYRRYHAALSGHGPYLLEGVMEMDTRRGEPILRAEQIWQVNAGL